MTAGTLRKIRTVEARSGYRLLISWFQGPQMIVDLSEEVRQGGVFDALRSETEFSRVRVGERNRVIEWPEPKDDHGYPVIEIDADALYLLGSQQKTSASMRKLISTAQSIGRSERPT